MDNRQRDMVDKYFNNITDYLEKIKKLIAPNFPNNKKKLYNPFEESLNVKKEIKNKKPKDNT